jgi:uncharacterized protein YjbI with pentapeptide repeats
MLKDSPLNFATPTNTFNSNASLDAAILINTEFRKPLQKKCCLIDADPSGVDFFNTDQMEPDLFSTDLTNSYLNVTGLI